ncbi:MAG: tetratricopeptide repeat protein [Granulosicoccus sp.]
MSTWKLRTYVSVSIGAIMLSACSGGGSSPQITTKGVNGTYLYVTHQEQPLGENSDQVLYYGTQNVGTSATLAVRIANRGADIYPLKKVSVVGEHADQFTVEVLDEIILNPAEAVNVDVAFRPTTEIEVEANGTNPSLNDAVLTVDYDVIQMVDESVNINEQSYYKASDLEAAGDFRAARNTYSTYLQNDPVTTNKRRAAIRLPIIDEAQIYDGQEDLGLYLDAMSQRDKQDYVAAVRTLDRFIAAYPDSYLADDAYYLKGYIQLIDLNDPANALRSMQTLRKVHPDTTYFETSIYSEAIAQIELGNQMVAKKILLELKKRHTGIDTLGIQLPKDNLLSRMWFERATQMLESV